MPNKNLTAAFVAKVKASGKRTDYFDAAIAGLLVPLNPRPRAVRP